VEKEMSGMAIGENCMRLVNLVVVFLLLASAFAHEQKAAANLEKHFAGTTAVNA
jgi:hypothetical protein